MQAFFHTLYKSTWPVRIQLGRLVGIRRLLIVYYFAKWKRGFKRQCQMNACPVYTSVHR